MDNTYLSQEQDSASSVPVFLLKLVSMLDDSSNHQYVDWTQSGTSFIVKDQVKFSKEVLPKYFKHNKFASFVRQLNMYGFRKITSLTQAGLTPDKDEVEFYHYRFIRGEPQLLSQIKRKVNKPDSAARPSEDVVKVLADVKQLRTHQDHITQRLSDLQKENKVLYQEVVSLRNKHAHQQKVVNKLIQFLVNLVQQTGMGVKRKLPLMIEDGSTASEAPNEKFARQTIYVEDNSAPLALENTSGPTVIFPGSNQENPSGPTVSFPTSNQDGANSENRSNVSGPYITEVTNATDMGGNDHVPDIYSPNNMPMTDRHIPHNDMGVNQPQQNNFQSSTRISFPDELDNFMQQPETYNMVSPDTQRVPSQPQVLSPPRTMPAQTNVPTPPHATLPYEIAEYSPKNTRVDLNQHVDYMQNNIDNIQDMLFNNDQVELDYGLIHELFSTSPDIMPHTDETPASSRSKQSTGNEVVLHPGTDQDLDLGDLAGLL